MNKQLPIKQQWSHIKYVLGLCVLLLILFHFDYFIEWVFYEMFNVPYDSLFAGIARIVLQAAVFIVVIGIGLRDQHKTLSSVCFFKKVNAGVWVSALLCAIGYTLFSYYLTFLFYSFSYEWNTKIYKPETGLLINIINIAIIPAVVEEILFKGLIFTILKKYYSTIIAAIIASLMFAGLHLTFIRLIPLFALSCYGFWLYLRSGSIIIPILLHFTNNLCTLILINEPFDYVGTFYAALALLFIGSYFLHRASKTVKEETIP